MSKGKFTQNFEFLQFAYDYIAKNCGEQSAKYKAYDKRLEIIKSQFGSIKTDIKKYLPTHLIPNDLILKMDKQKFFGSESTNNLPKLSSEEESESINDNVNPLPPKIAAMMDKYKDFFEILKDDLRKRMDRNLSLSQEIGEIEEERQYYLDKIKTALHYCQKKISQNKIKPDSSTMLQNIEKIITHQPEDFK
jgi:hypothetical protein